MNLSETYIQKYIHNLGKFKDDPIEVLSKGFLPDYTSIVDLEARIGYITALNNSGVNDKSIDIDLNYYKSELNKLKNDHGL